MAFHFRPILPVRRAKAFDDPRWAFELKYDGFRAVAHMDLDTGACTFYSKTGKEMRRFRDFGIALVEVLRRRRKRPRKLILDGELVVIDPKSGLPDFRRMMRNEGELSYVAFDLLLEDTTPWLVEPLRKRRERLVKLLPKRDAVLRVSYMIRRQGLALLEIARQFDIEGIVAKRLDDPYAAGTQWLKIVNPRYSQYHGRAELFRRTGS